MCGRNPESQPEHTLDLRMQYFLIAINLTAPPDIDIGVWVRYHGVLVAGNEAIVTATANLVTPIAQRSVRDLQVGFRFSLLFPRQNETSSGLPATTNVVLFRFPNPDQKTFRNKMDEEMPAHMFWATAGDYAPTIVVTYWNYDFVQSVFPDSAVHVEPDSEAVAENFNCVNTWLTYGLVMFGVIEIALSARDYLEKDRSSSSSSLLIKNKND
jgi:hypothetical protein